MMRAVLYARVSSSEQLREGFSIPAQVKLLREYAERHGLTIIAEYSDDETAKTTGRTQFSRMVEHLKKNRGDVILVEKVDRLYRNIRDYLTLDELGVLIHFVKEGGADRRDSDARFMHLIRVGMARKYVENLSEEVKKGQRQKCEEGGWPTWSPLGYDNVKEAVQKKATGGIVPNAQAPLVQQIYAAAATGNYSLGQLVTIARDSGLRGRFGAVLSKSALNYVLTNEAYTGRFMWSGVTYKGKYQPLIDRALFDRVQAVLRAGTKAKTREHSYVYAGMIRCDTCGGLLTGDRKKGRYVYYFCRCRVYHREARFDEAIVGVLKSLVVDEAVSRWIVNDMAAWYDRVTATESDNVGRLRGRLTELRNLELTSYEDKLRGTISEDVWRTYNDRWRREAEAVERQIAAINPRMSREDLIRRAAQPFELAQRAVRQYLAQDESEKAKMLRIVTSNFRVNGETIDVSVRSPFHIIAKIASVATGWGDSTIFEPLAAAYRDAILRVAA